MKRLLKSVIKRRLLIAANPGLQIGRDAIIQDASFEENVAVGDDCYVVRSRIGRFSYLGPRSIVADASIGRFCSIAADVNIGTGSHPIGPNVATHPAFHLHRPPLWDFVPSDTFREFKPTSVGSDVWLGTKVTVRDGITIGHGVVVGAGAVVVDDLEPYGIYAGVPARFKRWRFSQEQIAKLLEVAWWDRDLAWIRQNARYFADIATFLDRALKRP